MKQTSVHVRYGAVPGEEIAIKMIAGNNCRANPSLISSCHALRPDSHTRGATPSAPIHPVRILLNREEPGLIKGHQFTKEWRTRRNAMPGVCLVNSAPKRDEDCTSAYLQRWGLWETLRALIGPCIRLSGRAITTRMLHTRECAHNAGGNILRIQS